MDSPTRSALNRLLLATTVVFAALAILTAVVPDWLELFGLEPDGGNGTVELALVVGFGLAALACGATTGLTWRRA